MSFLYSLFDLVLLLVVTFDTLGFVAQNRKNPSASDARDFRRLCFTWVFYLAVRSLLCTSCTGFLGSLFGLASLVAKAYISVPLLRGTETLYTQLVENNVAKTYLDTLVTLVRQKLGAAEHARQQ